MVLEYSLKKKQICMLSGCGLFIGGVTLIGAGLIAANELEPTEIYLIPTIQITLPTIGSVMAATGITLFTLGIVAKKKLH